MANLTNNTNNNMGNVVLNNVIALGLDRAKAIEAITTVLDSVKNLGTVHCGSYLVEVVKVDQQSSTAKEEVEIDTNIANNKEAQNIVIEKKPIVNTQPVQKQTVAKKSTVKKQYNKNKTYRKPLIKEAKLAFVGPDEGITNERSMGAYMDKINSFISNHVAKYDIVRVGIAPIADPFTSIYVMAVVDAIKNTKVQIKAFIPSKMPAELSDQQREILAFVSNKANKGISIAPCKEELYTMLRFADTNVLSVETHEGKVPVDGYNAIREALKLEKGNKLNSKRNIHFDLNTLIVPAQDDVSYAEEEVSVENNQEEIIVAQEDITPDVEEVKQEKDIVISNDREEVSTVINSDVECAESSVDVYKLAKQLEAVSYYKVKVGDMRFIEALNKYKGEDKTILADAINEYLANNKKATLTAVRGIVSRLNKELKNSPAGNTIVGTPAVVVDENEEVLH